MTPKQNFFLNPTRRQYTIMLVLYAVAILLLTAGMTNIFEGAFIDRDFKIQVNPLMMMLIVSCTGGILNISKNYRHTKYSGQPEIPASWIHHPSTAQWILFTVIYLISFAAFIFSVADLIEEDSFRNFKFQNNMVYLFIWFIATVSIIRVNINYFRNRRCIS